jgi:hypothetical protein
MRESRCMSLLPRTTLHSDSEQERHRRETDWKRQKERHRTGKRQRERDREENKGGETVGNDVVDTRQGNKLRDKERETQRERKDHCPMYTQTHQYCFSIHYGSISVPKGYLFRKTFTKSENRRENVRNFRNFLDNECE